MMRSTCSSTLEIPWHGRPLSRFVPRTDCHGAPVEALRITMDRIAGGTGHGPVPEEQLQAMLFGRSWVLALRILLPDQVDYSSEYLLAAVRSGEVLGGATLTRLGRGARSVAGEILGCRGALMRPRELQE